ncbi:Ger(x)C family spore germination protein [Paenibacillus kobensis]|uniref:Ger(x)C family spore germination protein n=1 Tax=Paenibacillus kobensis TaxID=59841 RepID=UPI000FD6C295|nr:Ger(x)C family spore germination protein [Paenibacillus kobensis]
MHLGTYRRIGYRMVLALLLISLTGCWNRRELNEISTVLAMGIDRADGQYEVSVQVVDPIQMSQKSNTQRSATIVYSEKAPTLFEALRKSTTSAPRRMYLSHMTFLLFDETVAREGIKQTLDFLLRDHEVRPDFNMAVAREYSAKQMLSLVTPMEVLPAMDLMKSLRVSAKAWAPTSAVNVVSMMQMLTKDGLEPILTGLTIAGDAKKGITSKNVAQPATFANFKYQGIGVFRDDRLLGWLNESDSKSYAYITNHVTSTVANVTCMDSDDKFVVEVLGAKTKMQPSIRSGKPYMTMKIDVRANVGEMHCMMDLSKPKDMYKLQTEAAKRLNQVIMSGIRHVQQRYGVDIYGFGEAFHRKYPKDWHRWKADWNQRFEDMPVEIQIHYQLGKFGKIISPFDNSPETRKE